MADIYSAIIGVMSDVGAIGKNKRNAQQGFAYRGVDDVMNALQPAMVEHQIFVVPTILEQRREERKTAKGGLLIYSVCTIKYTFYAADGSSVECTVIGEGMDSGDKATNKAMSVAFKYACFQVFCIPTEEMRDPDADTPPPSEPAQPSTQKSSGNPTNELKKAQDSLKKHLVNLYGNVRDAEEYYNSLGEKINELSEVKRYIGEVRGELERRKHGNG